MADVRPRFKIGERVPWRNARKQESVGRVIAIVAAGESLREVIGAPLAKIASSVDVDVSRERYALLTGKGRRRRVVAPAVRAVDDPQQRRVDVGESEWERGLDEEDSYA